MQRGKGHIGDPGEAATSKQKERPSETPKPVDAWPVGLAPLEPYENTFPFFCYPVYGIWYSTSGNTSDDDGEGSPGILLKLWSGH